MFFPLGEQKELMCRLDNIREKIDRLSKLDDQRDVFGANKHRYELNECITRSALSVIEDEYRISLPDDYRAFLSELGNGGVGPSFGLYRIEQSIDRLCRRQAFERKRGLPISGLQSESPFTDEDARNIIQRRLDGDTYYAIKRKGTRNGALEISHRGAAADFLIINGSQRGKMWCLDENLGNWCPSVVELSRCDFLSWYEVWLEHWLSPGSIDKWRAATGGNPGKRR